MDESVASTRDQSVHSSGQIQALNDLIVQLRRIPENQELFEVFDGVQSLDDLSLDDMSPEELCGGREEGGVRISVGGGPVTRRSAMFVGPCV